MSHASVLQGLEVGGTAWVLCKGGVPVPLAPTAAPVPSVAEQLEQRYRDGFRDGRAAGLEQADTARAAATEEAMQRAFARAADEGHAQGQAKAREGAARAAEAAALELARRVRGLEAVARSLSDQASAGLDGVEDELVGLCHDVICRILGEAAAGPEGIRAMVRQALLELPGRPTAIHLHPEDLALLGASGGLDADLPARWVPDSTVELGGAVVRSDAGSLDARLETQLCALAQALRQTRTAQRLHRSEAP